MKFAERLRHARELSGLTQIELAAAVETTQSMISRYEKGENVPGVYRVKEIAKACGVSFLWLATGDEPIQV